ncbi:hypothetical protein [Pedobacter namyangjuensis]|uniref:hypothetical protein n=1 Tax=Pedobacter namyangjuensis TaxID=600626 RepID=UPI000DE1D6CD|nr:hypothetical protein [Pedobacter namyangjuensis]
MKKNLLIVLALLLLSKLNAQEQKADTIYIRTNIENVGSKFHSTFENQYNINFFFNVNWELHGFKRDAISFIYQSPKKSGTNEWSIFIKDDKEFLLYRNYYTLEQFTMRLKNPEFFQLIFLNKVQIIMLYGAKCSTKVELYPVKVSTDLSSEG